MDWTRLAEGGLDLVARFATEEYNSKVVECRARSMRKLPSARSKQGKTLGVLIGHSRKFWAPFVRWIKENPEFVDKNPVDTYAMQLIRTCTTNKDKVHYFWAHETDVAFQRVADLSAMATLYENIHLCIHEKYGPWIALRGIVVFEDLEYHPAVRERQTAVLSPEELELASSAFSRAMETNEQQDWINLRKCLPRFASWEYCHEQLMYHYTGDVSILRTHYLS